MKKYWMIAVLQMVTLQLIALPQDSAYIKVLYRANCTWIFDSEKIVNDRMCLQIGKCSSAFFSEKVAIYDHVLDSLHTRGYTLERLMVEMKKYPNSMQRYCVLKHYPDAKSLTFADVLLVFRFVYTEPIQIPQWTILPEKKDISGYLCQKAEASFYGRQWEAWFASDIPVSDGPWKLCGLPGLILEARDSACQYVFTCIGIEKLQKKIVIGMPKHKYTKCTKAQFNYFERLEVLDHSAFQFRMVGQTQSIPTPMHGHHTYTPIER